MYRPSPHIPPEQRAAGRQFPRGAYRLFLWLCKEQKPVFTPVSALGSFQNQQTLYFFFLIQWHCFCQPVTISAACGKPERSRFRGKRTQLVNSQQQSPAVQIYPLQLEGAVCGHPTCCLCSTIPKTWHTHSSCAGSALFLFMDLLPSLQSLCLAVGLFPGAGTGSAFFLKHPSEQMSSCWGLGALQKCQ